MGGSSELGWDGASGRAQRLLRMVALKKQLTHTHKKQKNGGGILRRKEEEKTLPTAKVASTVSSKEHAGGSNFIFQVACGSGLPCGSVRAVQLKACMRSAQCRELIWLGQFAATCLLYCGVFDPSIVQWNSS